MSRRLLAVLLAIVLGSCFAVNATPVQAQPAPAAPVAPPQQNDVGDELQPWVRPVQYGSAVLLVVGVGLLVYMRFRGRKSPSDNRTGSGGAPIR